MEWRQLNVRVEEKLLDTFKDAAVEKRLTIAEAVRWALAEWLERHG